MPDASALLNHIKITLLAIPGIADLGYNGETIYPKFLPHVKEPKFPCITLSYEVDTSEVSIDVDRVTLFVGIHCKEFADVNKGLKTIESGLHRHLVGNDTLCIYKCHAKGTASTPTHNSKLNIWESMMEFSVWYG